AFEGDEAIALGRAVLEVIAASGLDGAFDRLGPGIGEEYVVGKGGAAQPLAEPLLLGNAVQIGDVPELLRLLGQYLDEMGVGMAERSHGDAAGEVEIALASHGEEIGAFPAREGKLAAGIGRKEGRHGRCSVPEIKLLPGGGSKETQSIRSRLGACQSAP